MRSFTLRVWVRTEPARRSLVMAAAHTFHDVTESGTVNSKPTVPSGPVRSCGSQKAVSLKLLRRGTAAGGGGGGAAGAALATFPTYPRAATLSSAANPTGAAAAPRRAASRT